MDGELRRNTEVAAIKEEQGWAEAVKDLTAKNHPSGLKTILERKASRANPH